MSERTVRIKCITEEIKKLPDARRSVAESLLEKAKFMDNELAKLQKIIKKNGWTEEYQNGANQHGVKKSSEGEAYLRLAQVYNGTMKTLDDMLKVLPGHEEKKRTLMDILADD